MIARIESTSIKIFTVTSVVTGTGATLDYEEVRGVGLSLVEEWGSIHAAPQRERDKDLIVRRGDST